ncbi:MAG: hypothetical protein JO359_02375, partial [Candidatus Eremiobacteraeota bacterium]|nr:hypothetical protein [Candidatus Eremiobacteraeota bacterium]
ITAHEFQHLINFVNHCILAPTCLVQDDPWMNEGLSMLAEDFAVHQLFPNVQYDVDEALFFGAQFLQSPQSFNVAAFAGIDAGQTAPALYCNGCYGGAYLFQRYLYNRFGGDAYTRAMETGAGTSGTNLSAFANETPQALVGDFSIALAAAQNGVSATNPFTFAIAPGSTFVDQFGNPMTLPALGSVGQSALGSSTIYNSCEGCFFYVGVPTNKTSATLKVTDTSQVSAALAAGVVQH